MSDESIIESHFKQYIKDVSNKIQSIKENDKELRDKIEYYKKLYPNAKILAEFIHKVPIEDRKFFEERIAVQIESIVAEFMKEHPEYTVLEIMMYLLKYGLAGGYNYYTL